MRTKFIEVTNGNLNWGKFLLMAFDSEYEYESQMCPGSRLLPATGWNPRAIIVFDLQTREGAAFMPGGSVPADLDRHAVWVCPMFQPFLEWLYRQPDPHDFAALPGKLDLPGAEFAMYGYRRPGTGSGMVCADCERKVALEILALAEERKTQLPAAEQAGYEDKVVAVLRKKARQG